jgi:hypothetical protein
VVLPAAPTLHDPARASSDRNAANDSHRPPRTLRSKSSDCTAGPRKVHCSRPRSPASRGCTHVLLPAAPTLPFAETSISDRRLHRRRGHYAARRRRASVLATNAIAGTTRPAKADHLDPTVGSQAAAGLRHCCCVAQVATSSWLPLSVATRAKAGLGLSPRSGRPPCLWPVVR